MITGSIRSPMAPSDSITPQIVNVSLTVRRALKNRDERRTPRSPHPDNPAAVELSWMIESKSMCLTGS